MFGSFEQLLVEFFAEFAFSFVEFEQDFVVDCVVGEQLFLRKGPLVGHRRGVNFSVLARVLQLHLQFIITRLIITDPSWTPPPNHPASTLPVPRQCRSIHNVHILLQLQLFSVVYHSIIFKSVLRIALQQ